MANEKLECLKKLQVVLQKKFVLEDEVHNIPCNLIKKSEELDVAKTKLDNLTQAREAVEAELKSLSIRYDDAFNKRVEYEKQMEFISTQREYEALSKQLDEANVTENSLLKLKEAKYTELSKLNTEIETQSAVVDALQTEHDEEKKDVDALLESKNAEISALDAECSSIRGNIISDELFDKFSNIVRKKDGYGIVPVYGQVCTGCDLILPVQFVIDLELKNQRDEIDYCPYCSRIIYKEHLDEETEKNYTFEKLENKIEGRNTHAEDLGSKDDNDTFDESMEMDDSFDF